MSNSALVTQSLVVFVDLHPHASAAVRTVSAEALTGGVVRLATIADLYDVPVLFSGLPVPAPSFLPALGEALRVVPDVLVRTTASAFDDPQVREAVARSGRTTLLVAGVATEGAVVLTALAARASGLEVAVVVDACGGLTTRSEDAALRRLTAAGVTLTSTWTLGLELQHDFRDAHGQELLAWIARWTSAATG